MPTFPEVSPEAIAANAEALTERRRGERRSFDIGDTLETVCAGRGKRVQDRRAVAHYYADQAEIAEWRRDSLRYRYLRNTPPWHSPITVILSRDVGDDVHMLTQERLDAAIDAAMKVGGPR